MQTVAMRSDWSESAVFSTFTSGACVNYPASGEMYFDQGSLTIARGRDRFLVNTVGALLEHTPGTNDGEDNGDFLYADLFGDNGDRSAERNRTIFNVFYVQARRYGQIPVSPWRSKTQLTVKSLSDAATVVQGHGLEDAYYPPATEGGAPIVKAWRREVVFVRPSTFVVDDVAEAASASSEQWMAFHVAKTPVPLAGHAFDVIDGALYRGRIEFVAPAALRIDTVDLNRRAKVFRLEAHPTDGRAAHRWVTVFDARSAKPTTAVARALAAPIAKPNGDFVATQLSLEAGRNAVVVTGNAIVPNVNELIYAVPASAALHVVSDLSGLYTAAVTRANEQFLVRLVRTGAGDRATLTFAVDSDGRVSGN
jgi:hypothetical protein